MLKARQKLGKYHIERKLGEGGFALVYQARDTIEGVRVALKIPFPHLVTPETLEDFRHEVRVAARLEHPNILPLKNAEFIDGHFVITTALGQTTLDDRLKNRMSLTTAIDFAEQMLSAIAYAHENRVIHCDVKPDNFLVFPNNRLRLTDFGIARVAHKTIKASGAGTVGYIAPEQAMGKASFSSDVFSLGLICYCPSCFGPGFEPHGNRKYSDVRYTARCDSPRCKRKQIMPFMRYCPWCRARVRRKWKIAGSTEKCSRCGWGVLRAFWSYCPWCNKKL
jgi:serine/threonine protein kinase